MQKYIRKRIDQRIDECHFPVETTFYFKIKKKVVVQVKAM